MKALIEKKNDLTEKMEAILNTAKAEVRGLTEEETQEFENCETEILSINDLIEKEKKTMAQEILKPEAQNTAIADFANALRGNFENMTKGNNMVLIPTEVADQIITRVKELSPIFDKATKYFTGGNLVIPYVDESNTTLAMAWATEGVAGSATDIKTASVTLGSHLARALVKVSKSLMNNTDIDVVAFVVEEVAKVVASFLDDKLINGDSVEGIGGLATGVTKGITTASSTAITADELIALQGSIADAYQMDACWIMSRATRTALRQLKDSYGRYLLNDDVTSAYGYTLLGKPVFCSEHMPAMATGNKAVYYGDMSGLAVKLSEEMNTEILYEAFAIEHMVGVVSFVEFDAKVADTNKIAVATMK